MLAQVLFQVLCAPRAGISYGRLSSVGKAAVGDDINGRRGLGWEGRDAGGEAEKEGDSPEGLHLG